MWFWGQNYFLKDIGAVNYLVLDAECFLRKIPTYLWEYIVILFTS